MSDIVLGIRLTADGKDLVGAVRVSSEEIDKMTGATKRASSEAKNLNDQQKGLASQLSTTASAIGLYTTLWNKATDAALSALAGVKNYIKEAALLNARFETLGIAMVAVGNNVGYTAAQMEAATVGMQKTGISMLESRSAALRLIQAHIDLSEASKLARIAQDAAVIGNINSSEAFGRLVYGIQSAQVEVLRTIGLNVNFQQSYQRMADSLHKNVDALSDNEKSLARLNIVVEKGQDIAGTYEAAMTTAAKQMLSMQRYSEDLKVKLGAVFNETLTVAVMAVSGAFKSANGELDQMTANKELDAWGDGVASTFGFIADAVASAAAMFRLWGVNIGEAMAAAQQALSHPIQYWFEGGREAIAAAAEEDREAILNSTHAFRDALDARRNALKEKADAEVAATKAQEENFTSILKFYSARREAGLMAEADYVKTISAVLQRMYGDNHVYADTPGAGKATAGSDPFPAMLKSLKEKLLVDRDLTEVNKLQLSLDALSAKQLAAITPERKKELEDLAAKVDLNATLKAQMENDANNEKAFAKRRQEGAEAEANYANKIGDAILAADKQIEQMKFETSLIGKTNVEREQAISLRQMETAKIDAQTIARAQEAIAAKHAAEEANASQVGMWQSAESAGHQAFLSIFDTGKSVIDRLHDLIKTGLIDLLYQMTIKKWIINIAVGTSGAGVASSAFGASGGIGGGLNLLSSASDFIGGGAGLLGSTAAYSAATGAGAAQAAMLAAQTGEFGAAGLAATAGASAGMTAIASAIPYIGLGLAAASAFGLFGGDGDTTRTGNWVAKLGQVGGSNDNHWFDSSTGQGPFAADLAASEQKIAAALKLSASQIDKINAALAQQANTQYNFGMEHTDWSQSGAQQAIAADRLKAIAAALGTSVEGLTQQMVDAQKVIDLAPQKRQLEIQLMEAQGKTEEALAAKRHDELAALDASLRPLQEQIYAAEDLANAANDATGALQTLAGQIDAVRSAASSAVDDQISASRSAAQTARSAADAYRGLTASLADAVRQLRGGDLSPLLPGQKLAESGASLDALFSKAMTGDAQALAQLPQVATEFLNASRAYNASSAAYTNDFNRVMDMLAKAGAASSTAALKQDYMATLLEMQTGVLNEIKIELSKPSPDTAILTEQTNLLSTLGLLLKDQTGVILTGNSVQDVIRDITALDSHYSEAMLRSLITGASTQTDSLAGILAGTDHTISLLQQLVDLTAQKTAQDAAAAAAAEAEAQKAAADRALQQQISQATAAYQAQKAISDANLAAFRSYVSTMPGGEHIANPTENIAANSAFSYAYFEAYVGQEAAAFAKARELQAAYMDAFSAAYDLYKAIPGHASGLAYVPHDDYLMRAHQGEAVVDASTMSALRSYGIQVGAGITKADLDDLKKSIEKTNANLRALAESSSKDVREQTAQLAEAVEGSAKSMGRTIARAQEAGTRA